MPAALLGLLSLPLLWWWHVRRNRPPHVPTASLMFVLDEEEQTRLPRGRRWDGELLLSLAAATLLTVAAAGPKWGADTPRRTVRVVVTGGALATRTDYAERVEEALAQMADTLASADRLHVTWVPARDSDGGWRSAPRPSSDSVLGIARAGTATVRYVITDQPPVFAASDIVWIVLGAPSEPERVHNAGIVRARVEPGDPATLHLVIERTDPALRIEGVQVGAHTVTPPANHGALLTATAPLPPAATTVRLVTPGGPDVLPADDAIVLSPDEVAVFLAPDLPDAVAKPVRAAIRAVAGTSVRDATAEDADLVCSVAPHATPGWSIRFAPEGPADHSLPAGQDVVSTSPLVRDLVLDGDAAFAFTAPPGALPADTMVLMGRRAAGRVWPVLAQVAPRTIQMFSQPPPPPSAFWPLFFENVIEFVKGRAVQGGVRIRGVLDRSVTQLAYVQQPFRPEALRAVPPDRIAPSTTLRTVALGLGVLALLALWALPLWRRDRTPNLAPVR